MVARATYSAGTLIAFVKLRCTTRRRAESSSDRLAALGASASIRRPSAGSTNFSCASRCKVAPWRPRATAPSFGMYVAWSQDKTELAAPRSLISSSRRLSSASVSSADKRPAPAAERDLPARVLPARAVMDLRGVVLAALLLWDFALRALLRVFAMDYLWY